MALRFLAIGAKFQVYLDELFLDLIDGSGRIFLVFGRIEVARDSVAFLVTMFVMAKTPSNAAQTSFKSEAAIPIPIAVYLDTLFAL